MQGSRTIKTYEVSLLKRTLNLFLLFTHVTLLFGLSVIAFDRESFAAISNARYSNANPLMQSNLIDIFLSPWFAYLCLAFIPMALMKERLLKSYNARIYSNALASFICGLIIYIFICKLYSL